MRREAGFTLTELMVTMTIVAILMGIGVPSYKYITNSDRVSAEINGLLGDLQFARAEAIREGQPVTVCPAGDTNYDSCAADNTTWNTGWLVWADLNGDGAIGAGEILRVQRNFTSTDTLASSNSAVPVVFNREGFSSALGAVTTFKLKDASNNVKYTRCLTLQLTGQTTTATHDSDATCQ